MVNNKIKSIKDTFLYQSMDKGGYVTKLITSVISKGKVLPYEELLFEVTTINKYYKFTLKKSVMDAYKEGLLKPIVLPKGLVEKVPTSIPFILAPINGKIGAYVFIDNYKSYNEKDDLYSIDPKKFYCLMESAYIAIITQKNFQIIARNSTILTDAASIYAHMFIRVLNKKYALNVDKRAYTKVLYLAAKFFMVNQLNADPASDTVNNYALKVAEAESPFIVHELDAKFTLDDYKDISSFISAIQKNAYLISQSLSELVIRDYITDFVSMYHSSAIFGLEQFAYFMFVVDSVVLGAYLNNQAILEDIVGKSGAKIYSFISTYRY